MKQMVLKFRLRLYTYPFRRKGPQKNLARLYTFTPDINNCIWHSWCSCHLLFSFSHFGYLLNNLLRKQNASFLLYNDCVYCNSTGQFLWTLKMTYQGNQQMQNGYNVLVMYFWRKDPITIYSQTEFYRHPLKKNRHLIITSVFFVPEESPCILCKVNLLNRETFYGPPQCPVFCVSHYHKVQVYIQPLQIVISANKCKISLGLSVPTKSLTTFLTWLS